MPLIRPDALPIASEEVAEIRGRITEPFQFEVVRRDSVRCLFVRSDRAEPDPINDLESALNEVPDWATLDLSDVILLGHNQNFHVPARATHAILERRQRLDVAALQSLRGGLDPHYGVGMHRVHGDPTNTMRLGLRLPHASVKEVTDHDLNRLANALGPSIDAGELGQVRIAYLVAATDHMRLRGADVLSDLAPRWAELKAVPVEAATPSAITAQPEPQPEPPPARAPRSKPKRTIRVKPLLEVEEHLDAIGVQEKDQALLEQAEFELDRRLVEAGYDVVRKVEHDGLDFSLAAERSSGYPRRLLVRTLRRCERADAEQLLRAVRAVDADLLVCLTTNVSDAAQRRLLATKVKLLDPREAANFRL